MSRFRSFSLFPKKFGYFPYFWPMYLILPVMNLPSFSGWELAIGIGLILIFLVTYQQLYWSQGKVFTIWLLVQMTLTLVLTLFFNPYNIYMGFFSANFIGWHVKREKFIPSYVTFLLFNAIPIVVFLNQMTLSSFLYFLPFFIIMIASPFGIHSINKKKQLEKDLGAAKEQIEELIKREERQRIARDLHDTLGHTLSLITLKSQLVQKLVQKDAERALQEAKDIEQTSRAALRQVRELISDMRAVKVAEELASAKGILEAAGMAFHAETEGDFSRLSVLDQNILSLCIKEAVTNIVKHSRATRCLIQVSAESAQATLLVEDDGIGFDPGEGGTGNGLTGMKERLALIDGTFHLEHRDGKGVKLRVSIPIVAKGAKDGEPA
ncbi:sensor histidine kinase [Gorillibacterium sp. CAU 1737]|uniref:sensor histidine kinase n=1 Tax=Gorillibacterium sp. CAU 1737 TaxID=3140362 RepID=UPI00326170E3